MIQLTHLGRRTGWNKGDWLPVISSSHRREPAHRAFPKKIEDWDIQRLIKDYADAAERMKAGGMDGIELQAYGHLMDQFWSPITNSLGEPYGGELKNRMRFTMEVLEAIRERVGSEFIIGMRYTADEVHMQGLTPEDGITISKMFRDNGMVDFLNVVRGRINHDAGLTDLIPIQGMPGSPHLDFAGQVRKETGMPTFHAAKIPDIATARYAISEGLLDMVGITRAHIADPHIVRKIVEGREHDIRPCVGTTYCLDRIYQAGEALCIHNAATGRELTMPHDIPKVKIPKEIVIVSAGPAGLEAARVAGERGHQVTVFEAATEAGGQLRLTALSKRRQDMIGIVDWRMQQCEKLGVKFKFNTYAEVAEVIDENPDVVIIATGGWPDTEVLETGNHLVVSSWDIISGHELPGKNVLIFDDAGDHPGLQAAEVIAYTGAKVEIMTPDRSFAPEVMAMNLVPYMRSLQDKDVTFTVTRRLMDVECEGGQLKAIIGTDYSDLRQTRIYDQVVINHGTLPMDDLYFELKPQSSNLRAVNYDALIEGKEQDFKENPEGAFQLFRIGDAISARNTHAAIYDALRLVKDI